MIDRSELLSIVVCPTCKRALTLFSHCSHCGANYSEVSGTPALIPHDANRTVSFLFNQNRSVAGNRFRDCFKYPPRRGAAGPDKPYHLDLAHIDVLDKLAPSSIVLEVGCGGAQMRKYLESRNQRYVGIDISKTRVSDNLQQHGGPDLLCDSHFLPFADCVFDLVYTAAVTEHLACPYLAVQEVARVLKAGGFYLGNVSFLEPWHDDSYMHMSPLGVFELLTQAEFDVLNIWPGQGYSGFRAILSMGNKATKLLTPLGEVVYFIYRFGNRIRNLVKRRENWREDDIADLAKVAGATDWIAKRQ